MRIGNVLLKNKVVLAPMAGVTDSPFRLLAKEMGCALVFTEMVSAKGIICAPRETLRVASFSRDEKPLGLQLFGSDPEIMAKGAVIAAELNPDMIDINMGCPVKKVAGKGEGCALMRDPNKAFAITKAVCEAVSIPVTVKIRKGWDNSSVNAVELALALEEAGASAVSVHGRTREQGYSGRADWSIIAKVKENVHIPVIGNGDLWRPEDGAAMLAETGCDAIMVARGVLGNLWLIKRTVHYLKTGELMPEPDMGEKAALALRHLEMIIEAKGEYIGVREMRKHVAWYLKGVPGAAKIRNQVMQASSRAEMKDILLGVRQN
ncbi:MAG: tRNA dihydrouridine synthase DusB [Clostridiales bacterium]|jgi:tRNA-dihydrouridine synthase B|nr:tRNA dihydrouridine synthase DusB [Clostridiales bacterium]